MVRLLIEHEGPRRGIVRIAVVDTETGHVVDLASLVRSVRYESMVGDVDRTTVEFLGAELVGRGTIAALKVVVDEPKEGRAIDL